MAFNGTQTRTYDRTTPDDGLFLQAEFVRLYGNDNDLKTTVDGHTTELATLNTNLGATPQGIFATVKAWLQFLDNYLKIGKIEWFDQYFAPDANNPWLALTDTDKVLNAANWPDLVPYYRAKKLKYMPGAGSEKSAFDITHYARTSNVVTITLANTAPELALLAALAEENLVHGSFSGWIPFYLVAALGAGDVPIGDYAITALDPALRTISFAHVGANVATTAATTTIEIYPHRIPGSTTTARHYQISGRTLVSTNDADGEVIAGLRRRDRIQGHRHSAKTGFLNAGTGASFIEINDAYGDAFAARGITDPITDGTHGTPRTGKTTDPRALGAVPMLYCRRFIP